MLHKVVNHFFAVLTFAVKAEACTLASKAFLSEFDSVVSASFAARHGPFETYIPVVLKLEAFGLEIALGIFCHCFLSLVYVYTNTLLQFCQIFIALF